MFKNLSHIRIFPFPWEGELGQFTQNSDYNTNCAAEVPGYSIQTISGVHLATHPLGTISLPSHGAHNSPHLVASAATLLYPDTEDREEVYSKILYIHLALRS